MAAGVLPPSFLSPSALHRRHEVKLAVLRIPFPATPIAYVTTMVVEQVKRKVYPYSIVPGGAEDVRQAKLAMTDLAVRANYVDMNLAQLKQVKLTKNLTGYVSYRWGDRIYWTKKALTLRAGESIFTDGTHIVRGRCLNCYSALPMSPVRPTEPTELAMDKPVEMPMTVYTFPKLPVMAPELPIPPGELTPVVPVLAPVLGTVGKTAGGIWFPLIPIIPPIHHHPSSPPLTPVPPPPGSPPVPPVAIVPEPQYGWLLAAGFLALALAQRLRRRQQI